MKLKEQIIQDIQNLANPLALLQLFDFLELIKNNERLEQNNTNAVLTFAGSLTKEDSEEIKQIIKEEFNETEGEW